MRDLFEPRPDLRDFSLVPDNDGHLVGRENAGAALPIRFVDGELKLNLDMYEAAARTRERSIDYHYYQLALDIRKEVDGRADRYLDHARIRAAMAPEFRELYKATGRREYLKHAESLEGARQFGVYGFDTLDSSRPVIRWFDRAGLVKYCPDDARDAAMRAQARYVPRLVELMAEGYEVRFGVFTWPNVPRWHLAAGADGIFNAFRDRILFAKRDGSVARSIDVKGRLFPSLKGAVATLEAPLSRRGDWNIHLNVLMVFKPEPGDGDNWRHIGGRLVPDYQPLREAWGAQVEFREVPADPAAAEAAVRELVKYPFKAISLKTDEKQHRGAPPWLAWPLDAKDEWHMAHKAFRRTRNWGALYHSKLAPAPPPCPDYRFIALGTVRLSPSRYEVSVPMPADASDLDSIIGTKFRAPCDRGGPDPPPKRRH